MSLGGVVRAVIAEAVLASRSRPASCHAAARDPGGQKRLALTYAGPLSAVGCGAVDARLHALQLPECLLCFPSKPHVRRILGEAGGRGHRLEYETYEAHELRADAQMRNSLKLSSGQRKKHGSLHGTWSADIVAQPAVATYYVLRIMLHTRLDEDFLAVRITRPTASVHLCLPERHSRRNLELKPQRPEFSYNDIPNTT